MDSKHLDSMEKMKKRKEVKFEKAKNKAPLIAKIYAYIMKKRTEREASKEKDTAEIIDLIEILKSAV